MASIMNDFTTTNLIRCKFANLLMYLKITLINFEVHSNTINLYVNTFNP
jgi:hypothetical protein